MSKVQERMLKFVAVWENSDNKEMVAQALNLKPGAVEARATNYRKKGINLKKMPRKTNNGLDVVAANNLIGKIRSESSKVDCVN